MLRHSSETDWLDSAEFLLATDELFIYQAAIHHLSPRRVNRLEDEGRERERVLSKKLPLFRSFRPSWRRQTFLDARFAVRDVVVKEYPHAHTHTYTCILAAEKKRIQYTFPETMIFLSKEKLNVSFIKWWSTFVSVNEFRNLI